MDNVFPSRYSYDSIFAGEVDNFSQSPQMPWTIEQQLRAYALSPQRTERHEILWTSWLQDRRWLSQLLEYTVFSAPMYSRHNASHCETVIHNIECLLGEDEIRRLSATDCFAILVAVYLHDIGMVTISSERQNTVISDGFSRFVQQLRTSPDASMRWAAETFDRMSFQDAENEDSVGSGAYGERQYDVYRAVVLLLAEFQRKQHADASADRVERWIRDPAKLQGGLLMTGIPIRIFLQIAACARAHGESDFDTLLATLPKCDDGFTQDTYHPMFIAVLLSLGDILDLDNERFNPFTQDVVGNDLFPAASQTHYRKHQAIRSLHISPKRIRIAADCSNTDELRLLCQDMDWLEGFLKNCSYHWASIAPDNFCGCLPVIELTQVSLNGASIPPNLVTTKFELSQKKAFHLLSGANLYARSFPFLRELLQNAIDAVKLQYWTDYSASEFGKKEKLGLCEASRQQPFRKYPIHVDMAVKKRMRNSDGALTPVVEDDFKLPLSQLVRDYEFGVEVKVQDCGIGISAEDIQQISKVGSSHECRQELISHMPEWLRPTGHFGIGLQSLFLVDDHFKCTTRTRRGECYEMTFHSGDRAEGYINIIPRPVWSPDLGDTPYGTCFSVFVSERYKVSHNKDMTGWLGMDPYQEDYAKYRKLRRSIELMVQLEEDFTSLIGEHLFPIIPRELELDKSLSSAIVLREKLRERTSRSSGSRKLAWQTIPAGTRYLNRNEQEELRCWLFQKQEEKLPAYQFGSLNDGSAYYFDVEHGKLYGWSQHAECFFCCSAHRILRSGRADGDEPQSLQSVRLFVKGLFIREISCAQNDLFDYIDVKNDQLQDYLQMSRDGLTAQGVQKVTNEIIPQIQRTFDLILKRINEINLDIMAKNRKVCLDAFSKVCKLVLNHRSEDDRCFPNVLVFEKKFKKRLESIPLTAFTRSSLLALTDETGNKVFLEHEAWGNFWLDVFHSLIKDSPENREQYWKDGMPNTRVCLIGDLRAAFEDEIKLLEQDLSSELLEWLFCELNGILKKAKGQKNSTLNKASLDQFRDKLLEVHQVVFLCALCFFYANSCKPAGSNSCAKDQEPCSWEHLNHGISRLLHYEDSIVIPANEFMTEFIMRWKQVLFLPCLEEKQVGSVFRNTTISNMMLRGQHYAVFSSRSSQQGHWKHMLVHLSPFPAAESITNEPDATVVELLNWQPAKASECLQRENLLEKWHDQTIGEIYRTYFDKVMSKPGSLDSSLWENPIIRWMVKNLPSLSVGSDLGGNNRINVLTFQTPPQLFFNTCMINLLEDRMRNAYETHNVQRMRTTTWDGLALLNCKDSITTNILRVDRGKVSEANQQYSMLMAFPSDLPALNIQLPNGKTLEAASIHTTYDLLERVKCVYTQDGDLYGFTYAHDVLECAQNIAKLLTLNMDGTRKESLPSDSDKADQSAKTPSPAGAETSGRRLLDILQKKFEGKQDEGLSLDLSLPEEDQTYFRDQQRRREEVFLSKDPKRLNDNLETLYLGDLLDSYGRWQEQKRAYEVQSTWSKVDLPDDPGRYLNSLLVFLYDFDLAEAGEWPELQDFDLYKTTAELKDNIQKVYWAACYLFLYAGQQYQDEFLENVCCWWMDEVWAKDSGQETFIAYSKEHLSVPLERQTLLDLYKEQIRMLIRAQIAPLISPIDNVLAGVDAFKAIYQFHAD